METYLIQDGSTHDITLEGGDFQTISLGGVQPGDRGRIVEFSLRLDDMAPDRRVALAVALTERDGENQEYPRGIRTYVVPAHSGGTHSVWVRPIRFILPEGLDVSGDGTRCLVARVDAHYIERNGCSLLAESKADPLE